MRPVRALALGLALAACNTPLSTTTAVSCVVSATPEVPVALPGAALRLGGGPFTTPWDTVVRIGGVHAEVLAVTRDDCTACDVCRVQASCSACGTCDACTDTCATCVQTVDVRVPDVAPGDRPLVLVNRHGATAPATIGILALPDGGDTDPGGDSSADTLVLPDVAAPAPGSLSAPSGAPGRARSAALPAQDP